MYENRSCLKSVSYSYTVTLRPQLYGIPGQDQYDKTSDELVKHLSNICAEYTLVAELTSSYNVHYHGTVSFALKLPGPPVNLRKRFVDSFRKNKLFGFVQIKQIDDEPGWIEYISKSLEETCNDLGRRPILKDDFNYWTPIQYAKYGTEW